MSDRQFNPQRDIGDQQAIQKAGPDWLELQARLTAVKAERDALLARRPRGPDDEGLAKALLATWVEANDGNKTTMGKAAWLAVAREARRLIGGESTAPQSPP